MQFECRTETEIKSAWKYALELSISCTRNIHTYLSSWHIWIGVCYFAASSTKRNRTHTYTRVLQICHIIYDVICMTCMRILANSIYFGTLQERRQQDSGTQVSHKNKSGRIYAASLAFCIFYVRVEEAAFCYAMHKILVQLQLLLLLLLILLISFLDSFLQLFAAVGCCVQIEPKNAVNSRQKCFL